MVIIVSINGAAAAGRTTIGGALAAELGWTFVDADDHHPPPPAETRHASLRAIVARAVDRRESLVLACPPLTASSRAALRHGLRPVRFVVLEAMATLQDSRADEALHVDAARPPEEILSTIRIAFGV